MRERSRKVLFGLVAVAAVIGSLMSASSAFAVDTVTALPGGYPHCSAVGNVQPCDARNSTPQRGGTWVRADYGPFNIQGRTSCAASSTCGGSGATSYGQIHNNISSRIAPCTGCYITDVVPNLVLTPGGPTQNIREGLLLHHYLVSNPALADVTCPSSGPGFLGQRLFASGNERTQLHLPQPFGYQNTAPNWNFTVHLVNRNNADQAVYIEMFVRYASAGDPVKPVWLDIDGMTSVENGTASCGDSDYTIPTGYTDSTKTWTSTVSGRFVEISGHTHDVDITGPGATLGTHVPATGGGRAVSAEIVGGSPTTYYGPSPPNGTPPGTGATMCRSEGYWGDLDPAQWLGHLDTMSLCGIRADHPAGAQTKLFPTTAAWPASAGFQITSGQQIKVHSEYDNGSGFSQTDAMGIMIGYLSETPADPNNSVGYPRPNAAGPLYAALVPAYTVCGGSPNRTHAAPWNYQSCSPPTRTSGQLTVGEPSNNGQPANFVGSVKMGVLNGNAATTADEADVTYTISLTDVRNTDLTDYTGQLQVRSTMRITDRNNGPPWANKGTGQSVDIPVTVPCTATDPGLGSIGSACSLTTSADAVMGAGTVREQVRSNWQVDQLKVYDGGPDGLVSTGPNTLFAVQGLFVP